MDFFKCALETNNYCFPDHFEMKQDIAKCPVDLTFFFFWKLESNNFVVKFSRKLEKIYFYRSERDSVFRIFYEYIISQIF